MKHTAIAGLFVAAAMLASPVFAADSDLCTSNIQTINDFVNSDPAISKGTLNNVKAALKKAKTAQASGDFKQCIEVSGGMIQKMNIRAPNR
ncbi:hypothetical protein [Pseudomonas sp. NPDC089569]|uniref:hypothetical protein n=1 Tax=Pseudomonas sp. NPDC089569 TaxID=3390722 RepID=UPI003D041B99